MPELEPAESTDRRSGSHLTALVGVFAFLLGVVVSQPSPIEAGQTITVQPGLSALVVRSGYDSPFDRATSLLHRQATGALATEDWLVTSTYAYAAALALVDRQSQPALLVDPARDGAAWSFGLRKLDIVTQVLTSYDNACKIGQSAEDSIRKRWDDLSVCGGEVTVLRGAKTLVLRIPVGGAQGSRVREMGRAFAPAAPRRLQAAHGNSSGLVLGLFYLDQLTKGSLVSQDHVAATGSITDEFGTVGQIGALGIKTGAARRAGADVLFIPHGQRSEIGAVQGVDVYEVASLVDAVEILCKRGSTDRICLEFHS